MLSTKDNPFNPFTEFDEWYAWDTNEGYHSLSLLGRVVRSSPEHSEQVESQAIEDAIEEIVTENVSGMHIKVASPLD